MSSSIDAFIALGSNLGDRARYLSDALATLAASEGVELQSVSHIYETDPIGPPPQGPYYNAAAKILTTLPPRDLLALLHRIEAGSGRERSSARNEPRVLDLDLLFFGDLCSDTPELILPHPRLHERPFVLEPLAEIAPEITHPRLGVSVAKLVESVRDPAAVRRMALLPLPNT